MQEIINPMLGEIPELIRSVIFGIGFIENFLISHIYQDKVLL